MKSINRFIYSRSKEHGLNAVFDISDKGLRYELLGIVLFIGIWVIVGHLVFSRPEYRHFQGFLPGPTFKALFASASQAHFWGSVGASLKRVLVGIVMAAVLGIPTGLVIGFYPRLRALAYSPIQFLRMISPLSWMPVALLIFASFESAVWFLIVMATIWPIILNTAIGVMNINPQWMRMAMNQGASNLQLLRTVAIPASFPYVLTSLRLALGVAWIVLVPAEFLGVSSGLGYLINDARDTMEYDRLMAMIIAIGILGFLLDRCLQTIQTVFSWAWFE